MSEFIETTTFADAYARLLGLIYENPDHVSSPRGQEVREVIAPTIRVLDPTSFLYESEARSTPMRYLAAEFVWYFAKKDDVSFISDFSSMWERLRNPDGASSPDGAVIPNQVNSNYGRLTMGLADARWGGEPASQWEWAVQSILADPDTRQAVLHINRPSHQFEGVRDFPCTMFLQFILRDGKLDLVASMRSADCIFGTSFDVPMFCLMQQTMAHNLRSLGVRAELGHFTLTASSWHIYQRDYETVEKMLSGGIRPSSTSGVVPSPIDVVKWPGSLLFSDSKYLRALETGSDEQLLAEVPLYSAMSAALRSK